jgi:cytochrome c-type biogenesis protein CcmH
MKHLICAFLIVLATPVLAVEPGAMLDDAGWEARAREISKGLRCPVCQNESIDESHADLSRDLRLLLRERLVAGDSDPEAVEYIVARYGEFVLLQPTKQGVNLILWIAGPLMLLLALAVALRGGLRNGKEPEALSEDEENRLRELIGK